MKTEHVFSVIRELNEILSLTNEPDKLVNTALDTLTQILNIECCWIQTIGDRKEQKLVLAGDRGFTEGMRTEIAAIDLKNDFAGQTIGMGHKITIPDLNNDGAYGLDTFRTAGYRWLVAVPLMTYRAYGLLGTASKDRKLLDKDTTELIMVIGGLIANALSKAQFMNEAPRQHIVPRQNETPPNSKLPEVVMLEQEKTPVFADTRTEMAPVTLSANATPENTVSTPEAESPPAPSAEERTIITSFEPPPPEKAASATETESPQAPSAEERIIVTSFEPPPPEKPLAKPIDPAFRSHTRKMERFRRTHK